MGRAFGEVDDCEAAGDSAVGGADAVSTLKVVSPISRRLLLNELRRPLVKGETFEAAATVVLTTEA